MKEWILLSLIVIAFSCRDAKQTTAISGFYYLSIQELANKIKGGWAGQVIGCTYGGPTEFHHLGTMIQDYIPINWDSSLLEYNYINKPGLYDDIYMDLTFVDVLEREGLDASATEHAKAFAYAKYSLWHANQCARYNILNGIEPPQSGYWKFNPHADDLDFQIEADFAGLMSPGIPASANDICDKIGHIMNYGDGWYGGVFVANIYAQSFISSDIENIIRKALKSIPEKSTFYQCISDVIQWHMQYPDDWKQTWFELQKKWSSEIGCPDGVFSDFDIDAKINSAYIVTGLLYGNGDYTKTLDIATRCGQDSDCNPASAGGILGAILGYDAIPDYWKQGIDKVEDMDFKYTTMSLNDVYKIGLKHALEMIKRTGGRIEGDSVLIKIQQPVTVKYEQSFEGLKPVYFEYMRHQLNSNSPELTFEFKGNAFCLSGNMRKTDWGLEDKILNVEVFFDGKLIETAPLSTDFTKRRYDLLWNYDLPDGTHTVKMKLLNKFEGYSIQPDRLIVYDKID